MTTTEQPFRLRVQPSRNRLTIRRGINAEGRPSLEILGPREYALAPWQALKLADALVDYAEQFEGGER